MGKRLYVYNLGTVFFPFSFGFLPRSYYKQLDLEHDLFLSAISAGVLSGIGLDWSRYNGTWELILLPEFVRLNFGIFQ